MAFEVPSLEDIHETLLADYANRFPGANLSKYSDNWKRLRILAGAVSGLHAHVDSVNEALLPDGADGDELDRVGSIYGLTRNPATIAHKDDALRVFGTAGSTASSGNQLTSPDGIRYQLTETQVIPAAGYVDMSLESIDTGSAAKKQAPETLTFVSPPSGIESTAELQIDIDEGGDDIENDGSYRARILDKLAFPGMGGNANDYRTWATAAGTESGVDGVASAYVYPIRQGLGSVDVAALFTGQGAVRLLDLAERQTLQAYIITKRPVSVADFRIVEVFTEAHDIDVTVIPEDDAAFAFDWDDSTPLIVAAWTAGTRTLQFTTARPDEMLVGDRLVHKSAHPTNKHDGSELVIEALVSTDKVIVKTAPTVAPVAADVVYSGGPLVEPVRQLLLTHINSLGPVKGLFGQGSWEGTLRTSTIFKIVQTYTGVLDSTIILPTVNTDAAEFDDLLGIIIPRQVLIRRGF